MILFWLIAALLLLFGFVVAFGAPYVPSLKKELHEAFEHVYKLGASDVIVDLGSGDGQVLAIAARKGAFGYGYELNPILVLISKVRLGSKAKITMADMWRVTLPKDTTLVYVFTVSRDIKKLLTYLQRQADTQQRSLNVMTFGAELKGVTVIKKHRGHTLYTILPQQAGKP